MVETKRQTLAQVLVCLGCCCGRTDKGKPAVPTDWLKAEWKQRRLLKHVQLSICGCLGPCEIANVVAIVTPGGTEWFGAIDGVRYYEALLEWAGACAAAGRALPAPACLEPHRFERYAATSTPVAVAAGDRA